ncbi:hypothetical protein Tco_1234473 [Tanacetum coccineum]
MIGTLMYLTASRPDLTFDVCMCARYQAKPTEKHFYAVKRIFKYLRGTANQGLLERIEFLINKLGMRSFTPETLKQLADEAEE